MELQSAALTFPTAFCCNCGDTNCMNEVQDTRITRYFGLGGTETTFHLAVPVCAACRKTTRRRPAGFFARLLVFALSVCLCFGALLWLGSSVQMPMWFVEHTFTIGVVLGAIVTVVFYRLRRPKPPQTSFYQPVRIKEANVQFAGVMDGPGQVLFMKLAFTNPDYLNAFRNANRDAIDGGRLAVVQA
jgi:Protein of unknown function (DUF983)